MSQTVKYLIAVLIGAALGYGLMPKKIETKTVTVETKQTEAERNKHKETTTTEVVKPDGTKETVTKTVEDSETQKKTDATRASEAESVTTYGHGGFGASVLAGIRVGDAVPDYGLLINKNVLGPINIGAFGFKSGVVGLSLGLQF